MPNWRVRFLTQWSAAAAAPIPLATAMAVAAGVTWLALTWSYGGTLRSKDARLERQDRQIADYRQKLDGASADEARARIEALENRLRQLATRPEDTSRPSGPRHLSEDQRKAIAENTLVPGGAQYMLLITYEVGCPDCAQYADQLQLAITGNPGWAISAGRTIGQGQKSPHGIAIQVADPNAPPPPAVLLARALTAAGVKFDLMASPPVAAKVGLLITALGP
jgi:hypothetical protein